MSITRISRFVLKHKLAVAVFWIVVAVIGALSASSATGALSQSFSLPGRESTETDAAIVRTYGNGGGNPPLVAVVTLPAGTTVDSPGIKAQLGGVFAQVRAAAPRSRIVSYASTSNRVFVSKDGRTTFGLIYPLYAGPGDSPELPAIKAALASAHIAGQPVLLTGLSQLESDTGNGGGMSVLAETLIGGLGALIVLAWVFGSFLALVPLVIAGIAIVTCFLLVWGLTTFTDVIFIVQYLIALIGLGVAIDYSLLVITRWREERAAGLANEAAVQRAMETAGHSVIFSGSTVAIGLFAMITLPVPFLRSVAFAGLLIPAVSVAVAITFLPAVLATIGPRLDWPRLRRGDQHSKSWAGWGRFVVRRHWLVAGVALAILIALIVPVFSLRIGEPSPNTLAQSGEPHDGLVALEKAGISQGVLTPIDALVRGADPATVARTLSKVNGVTSAIAPAGASWRRANTAIVTVFPAMDGNSSEGRALISRVRNAAHAIPGQVRIGGAAAENADSMAAIYGNFPLMIGLIAVVTFVLLLRAFRSVVLPLKALALNALSVAAAYGIIVLVWQKGYGSHLIWGISATGAITDFVPLMVFAFLFGLSMDYEVFLLARMREEYDHTGSTNEAVVCGLSTTARLVTFAALILFLAMSALTAVPETSIKILGTGLAAGILLDATVVRTLLAPAVVSLMGHVNWWLPSWLQWFMPKTGMVPGRADSAREAISNRSGRHD